MANGKFFCKKVTLATDGYIDSITAWLKQSTAGQFSIAVAVWTDSSGPVTTKAGFANASSSFKPSSGNYRAYTTPVGVWLTAGDYWIGVAQFNASAGSLDLAYASGTGSDKTLTATGSWIQDSSGATIATTTNDFSVYADVRLS
jgi:hypothetical protein